MERLDPRVTPINLHTEERFPLSFAQQRLWFLDQLSHHSQEYLIPRLLRLRGVLDIDALEAAFSDLVTRHEALRTRFVIGEDGQPLQAVDAPRPVRLRHLD